MRYPLLHVCQTLCKGCSLLSVLVSIINCMYLTNWKFTLYSHPPSFDMVARKGMCRNYCVENIANKKCMLGCVTFMTRHGDVVGKQSTHFVGIGNCVPGC